VRDQGSGYRGVLGSTFKAQLFAAFRPFRPLRPAGSWYRHDRDPETAQDLTEHSNPQLGIWRSNTMEVAR